MTTKKEPSKGSTPATDVVVDYDVLKVIVDMIAARVVEKLTPILLSAKDSKEGGRGCEQARSGS